MTTARLNLPCAAAPAIDGAWLEPLAGHWIDAALMHLARHDSLVRVTIVALRGSAPREPGATMLVHERATIGTIGGGRLEWHAAATARQMLGAPGSAPAVQLEDLTLGPQLGQCCGGRVELWFERLTRRDLPTLEAAAKQARHGGAGAIETRFAAGVVRRRVRSLVVAGGVSLTRERASPASPPHLTLVERLGVRRAPLWIFGAGHVGQAVVRLLAPLALFDIRWIDARPHLLPATLPDGVATHACTAPLELLRAAAADTRYLVLTHDHALDYALCRAILQRGDARWLGLIGSASKAARFRSRLLRDGVAPPSIASLTCPIGVPGVPSKLPAAIAIAIAAQLLQQNAATQAAAPDIGARAAHACSGTCASCGTAGSGGS